MTDVFLRGGGDTESRMLCEAQRLRRQPMWPWRQRFEWYVHTPMNAWGYQKLEEERENPPLKVLEEHDLGDILIWGFLSPELWENACRLFKATPFEGGQPGKTSIAFISDWHKDCDAKAMCNWDWTWLNTHFLVKIDSSNSSDIMNSRVGGFVSRNKVARNEERDKSADQTQNSYTFYFRHIQKSM